MQVSINWFLVKMSQKLALWIAHAKKIHVPIKKVETQVDLGNSELYANFIKQDVHSIIIRAWIARKRYGVCFAVRNYVSDVTRLHKVVYQTNTLFPPKLLKVIKVINIYTNQKQIICIIIINVTKMTILGAILMLVWCAVLFS